MDFEIRQDHKFHAMYQQITDLQMVIASLRDKLATSLPMASSDGTQMYAPSAESLIERGVMAGWRVGSPGEQSALK